MNVRCFHYPNTFLIGAGVFDPFSFSLMSTKVNFAVPPYFLLLFATSAHAIDFSWNYFFVVFVSHNRIYGISITTLQFIMIRLNDSPLQHWALFRCTVPTFLLSVRVFSDFSHQCTMKWRKNIKKSI